MLNLSQEYSLSRSLAWTSHDWLPMTNFSRCLKLKVKKKYLYIYVCMYVCMYVCTYVRTYDSVLTIALTGLLRDRLV